VIPVTVPRARWIYAYGEAKRSMMSDGNWISRQGRGAREGLSSRTGARVSHWQRKHWIATWRAQAELHQKRYFSAWNRPPVANWTHLDRPPVLSDYCRV